MHTWIQKTINMLLNRPHSLIPSSLHMRHSIVLESSEFTNSELKSVKELRNYVQGSNLDAFKFNFLKLTGKKSSTNNETERIFLIPFLREDNLNQFESTDFIIRMTFDLFGVIFDNKNYKKLPINFLNQDPIEIESIHLGFPSKDFVILPTCPVCIKRLDKSISGLDVIECRDLFHSCCRENCRKLGQNCKVCCLLFDEKDEKGVMNCFDCGSTGNLWICLICGNLGCGRYKGGHAHNHFLKTGHAFALKSDSHHIWDYTLDKYVHWSIKSEEGTVVDVDESTKSTTNNNRERGFINEFTTAQLESQKAFFDERLLAVKRETQQEIAKCKQEKDEELRILKEEFYRTDHERKVLSNLSNHLKDLMKKLKMDASDLAKELETEKQISQGLCKSIDALKTDLETHKIEKSDLDEQVKDLMKHLEVIDLMGKAGNDPDIVEGKLLIRPVKKKNHK